MAAKQMMSIIATTSDRISDLVIKNGQLIFIRDLGRIAFDYKDTRTFYNQVTDLATEQERLEINPINGYYFIIETGIFWRYSNNEWNPLTYNSDNVVFIGDDLPELGSANVLYTNTTENEECISVWDEINNCYKVVADKTYSISEEEILSYFNN